MKKTVSIVVCTYANPFMLDNCLRNLRSVENGGYYELVVVSDKSPEQAAEATVAQKWGATHVAVPERRGYGNVVNMGVRATTGEIVLKIDNDVWLTKMVTEKLKTIFEDESIGVVGSRLYLPNGKIQHAGGRITWDECQHYGWHEKPEECFFQGLVHYPVFVTGAMVAFTRALHDQLGGVREDFFFGCEDSDFCFRAWEAGKKVRYEPEMEAVHFEALTRGKQGFVDRQDQEMLHLKWQRAHEKFRAECVTRDWNKIFRLMAEANREVAPPGMADVLVLERTAALGDVLAFKQVVDGIAKANPTKKVIVRTAHPEVFDNDPLVVAAGTEAFAPFGQTVTFNVSHEKRPGAPIVAAYQFVAAEAGLVPFTVEAPELHSNDLHTARMEKLLRTHKVRRTNFAVVHQSVTNWKNRNVPHVTWCEIVAGLKAMGLDVVIVGTERDLPAGNMDVTDLRGKTSLHDLHALIKMARVFVGGDSGPFHVMQATRTPAVALFTSVFYDLRVWDTEQVFSVGPATGCHSCYSKQPPLVRSLECPENKNYECTKNVLSEDVMEAVKKILARINP